jgi:hypothetical protein
MRHEYLVIGQSQIKFMWTVACTSVHFENRKITTANCNYTVTYNGEVQGYVDVLFRACLPLLNPDTLTMAKASGNECPTQK